MAQNKYDNEEFFVQYSKLPRSVQGLDGAIEWPTLRRMVGDVKDASILDLGCGYGWFCRWARESGARHVLGIDISEKMLAHAETYPPDSGIEYERIDLETITLPAKAYDLVYSSLTLHYIPNLNHVYAEVAKSLKPGGRFVFSVEHPIMSAPGNPSWIKNEHGSFIWPLNNYIDEGERVTSWLGGGDIRKYHYMVQTYLSLLLQNGFILKDYKDVWDELERKSCPDVCESGHRPYFLLIGAQAP